MTSFPVDNYQVPAYKTNYSAISIGREIRRGLCITVIIALLWSFGSALIIPYWPRGAVWLGLTGWYIAVYRGCRATYRRTAHSRLSYAAERVAAGAIALSLCGELLGLLFDLPRPAGWWQAPLRLVLAVIALTMAVNSDRTRRRPPRREASAHVSSDPQTCFSSTKDYGLR